MEYLSALLFASFMFTMITVSTGADAVEPSKQLVLVKTHVLS